MANDRPEFEKSELQLASDYLEYHVRMYADAYHLFLSFRSTPKNSYDPATANSLLESHLIHTWLIFDFLSRESTSFETDVLAIDFFSDAPEKYEPLKDSYLEEWRRKLGSRIAHLSIEAEPLLKSQQTWPIKKIAKRLIPALRKFLRKAPDELFKEPHKEKMLGHVGKFDFLDAGDDTA